MFTKMKIKKEIKGLLKEIEIIEKKRYRSQAALVEAILISSEPDDSDVDYFNRYTDEINKNREELHKLQEQLDSLKK